MNVTIACRVIAVCIVHTLSSTSSGAFDGVSIIYQTSYSRFVVSIMPPKRRLTVEEKRKKDEAANMAYSSEGEKSLLTKLGDGKKEGDMFEVFSPNCIARHNIVFPV